MVIVMITCSQETVGITQTALYPIQTAIAKEMRIDQDKVTIFLFTTENTTSAIMVEVEITYPQQDWRGNIAKRVKEILKNYNKKPKEPAWKRYLLKLSHYLGNKSWDCGNLQ
jgi:hypothetical protein